MLLIWVINLVFVLSIIVVVLAFVCMPVARVIAFPVAILAELILKAAVFIADIPYAKINIDYSYQVVFIVYIYTVLILLALDKKRHFGVFAISVSVVSVALMVVSILPAETSRYEGVRFSVLDVGQGQTVLADYKDTAVLVDCGGSRGKSAGDIVSDYMRKSDIVDIDAFIITHFDSDHMNGAKKLIQTGKVKELFVSENADNEERAGVVIDTARDYDVKINYVSTETTISTNGFSYTVYPTGWFSDSNENGLVVVFDKDDFEVVITGDLGAKSEKILCKTYKMPDAEVYIAGHHGSKSSSSLELLNTILPEFAVISVGADNRYGHPDEKTVSVFNDMGIKTIRTDQTGDVIFYSDELMKEAA